MASKGDGDGNGMSYYEPSLHVTERGLIGINVGGYVFEKPVEEWHRLACDRASKLSEPGTPLSGGSAREDGRPNTSLQASTPGSLNLPLFRAPLIAVVAMGLMFGKQPRPEPWDGWDDLGGEGVKARPPARVSELRGTPCPAPPEAP